jgi:hypothetical protein
VYRSCSTPAVASASARSAASASRAPRPSSQKAGMCAFYALNGLRPSRGLLAQVEDACGAIEGHARQRGWMRRTRRWTPRHTVTASAPHPPLLPTTTSSLCPSVLSLIAFFCFILVRLVNHSPGHSRREDYSNYRVTTPCPSTHLSYGNQVIPVPKTRRLFFWLTSICIF